MGQPAARATDIAGHGGTIILGSFTVFICGMPAARMGDPIACPAADGPKPHVAGNIVTASTTVKIDGAFAARMGDTTGCGIAGMSGKGMPPVVNSGGGAVFGDKDNGFLTYEYETKESASHASGSGEVAIFKQEVEFELFGEKYKMKMKGPYKKGSVSGGAGGLESGEGLKEGAGGTVDVELGFGSVTLESESADGKTKNSRTLKGPSSNANADILLGSDGKRTGVVGGGAIGGRTGSYETTEESEIPFADGNIKIKESKNIEFLGAGVDYGAGAYHDNSDGRNHTKQRGGATIGPVGFGGEVDTSFDAPGGGIPGVGVPAVPGAIASGAPTVLIG